MSVTRVRLGSRLPRTERSVVDLDGCPTSKSLTAKNRRFPHKSTKMYSRYICVSYPHEKVQRYPSHRLVIFYTSYVFHDWNSGIPRMPVFRGCWIRSRSLPANTRCLVLSIGADALIRPIHGIGVSPVKSSYLARSTVLCVCGPSYNA